MQLWTIEFTTDQFRPFLPEPCQVNADLYGFELSAWLAQALAEQRLGTRPEDRCREVDREGLTDTIEAGPEQRVRRSEVATSKDSPVRAILRSPPPCR